ncbi:hypothetical protein V1511DRAFT_59245 [Dipodascopsis uninucleata]
MQYLVYVCLFLGLVAAHPHHHSHKRSTPVAQKSFSLPDKFTPFKSGKPHFTIPGSVIADRFKVSSCVDEGELRDYSHNLVIHRDSPTMCNIGSRTLWFFDDTFVYNNGEFFGAAANSVAIANSLSEPAQISDISVSVSDGVTVAIPWTSSEAAIQYDVSERYALWAHAPCIPLGNNKAVHFWGLCKFNGSLEATALGYSSVTYEYEEDTGSLTIVRDEVVSNSGSNYVYGGFASLVVNTVIYLYALDSGYSGKYDIHLAKVQRMQYYDQSKWEYYDAATKSWSAEKPVPTGRRQSAAVISGPMPFSTGNIFYSQYHNAYLLVFFTEWADNTFYALTAQSPTGPWSDSVITLQKTTPGANGYNYGGQASPIFFEGAEESNQVGKELLLTYTYQDSTTSWYNKVEKLVFE